MKSWNEGKPYRDQIKPFGFLSAFTARKAELMGECCGHIVDPSARGRPRKPTRPKPVAPFERSPAKAARSAFDRETGKPVGPHALETVSEVLANYPFSCEAKFGNGVYFDTGPTQRRHVMAIRVHLIGKEANAVGASGEVTDDSLAIKVFR